MVTLTKLIPSIYPGHVSIYASTMDPMGYGISVPKNPCFLKSWPRSWISPNWLDVIPVGPEFCRCVFCKRVKRKGDRPAMGRTFIGHSLDIDGRWCTLMGIHWTSIEFIGKWMDLMDIHAHWSDKWRRPTRWGNKLTTWEWPLSITWRISQLWDNPPTVKGLLFNEAWRSERFFFMSCPAFMFIVTSLGTDRNQTDQFLRVPPYRNFRELQRCRTRLGPGPVHWLTTNFATLKCSSGGGPEHIEIIAEDSTRQGGFW